MLKNKSAFSLVELLVFVGIMSIFFIMAASVVTVSLRNMKDNENKIKATHYADQLEEWLRTQKEIDWGGNLCNGCSTPVNFTQNATRHGSAGNNYATTYCFNTSVIDNWQDLNACQGYSLGSKYKREVTFTSTPVSGYISQVNVAITVSWEELSQIRTVKSNTAFSIFEQ